MRAKIQIVSGLLVVASSLMAFALLGAKTHAQQKPDEGKDQQVAMSREALREIASELSLVRDSLSQDLRRLDNEYLQLRRNGAKAGDPKEEAFRVDVERQRTNFNRLVDQLKRLQRLAQGK